MNVNVLRSFKLRNTILLIIAFLIVGILEVPKLIKQKYWKELIVFSVIFLFTFAFSLLQVLGIKIPKPFFMGQ